MKKSIFASILCVIFTAIIILTDSLLHQNINVYATKTRLEDNINFVYDGRIFTYNLSKNITKSSLFNENYTINKYDRFSSLKARAMLMTHMLEIGLGEEECVEYLYPSIEDTINKIKRNIEIKPRNATLKIIPSSEKVFNISREKYGLCVDLNKLYKKIISHCINGGNSDILIPTITLNPSVTADEYMRFTHLRSDFSTNISHSSSDRKHNVKTALNSLNMTKIQPNEVFSFNKTVGRRTSENGYRMAKIIVNNDFVEGLGGGVCQVSTTLYNAALLAGLEIVEANKHSRQVSYVKYGFDAMVNFGSSDLKIRNNTDTVITIVTNYSSSKARIRIFGADMHGAEYRLKNEITDILDPGEEIIQDEELQYIDKVQYEDEYFYLKPVVRGMKVKSYREKYLNSKKVDQELLRLDKYPAQKGVKIYGIKKRTDCA